MQSQAGLSLPLVAHLYLKPGFPWENGSIELFSGKIREQFLKGALFSTLKEAQVTTDRWRTPYNSAPRIDRLAYEP